jgi:hypothetical protein
MPQAEAIINRSSIVGSHPVLGALLYASMKGTIETLPKGLALELAPLQDLCQPYCARSYRDRRKYRCRDDDGLVVGKHLCSPGRANAP